MVRGSIQNLLDGGSCFLCFLIGHLTISKNHVSTDHNECFPLKKIGGMVTKISSLEVFPL